MEFYPDLALYTYLDNSQILRLAKMILALFMAILFLQSGGDKVFNWKSNLEYFRDQFEKTFLRNYVKIALVQLAFLELASGLLCLAGTIHLLPDKESQVALWGFLLCALSFLALLFGQRFAKDYAGAAVLPGYFLISIAGIFLYLL